MTDIKSLAASLTDAEAAELFNLLGDRLLPETDLYTVHLVGHTDRKISAIRQLRDHHAHLSLFEAKQMIETAARKRPILISHVPYAQAVALSEQFVSMGALCEIEECVPKNPLRYGQSYGMVMA